jgi:hypothetical protein
MFTIAFNNVSGIFLDFIISNKICLCTLSNVFSRSINKSCDSKLYSIYFSINNLRQNVGSVHELAFRNPFCVSVMNSYEYLCSFILSILEYIL